MDPSRNEWSHLRPSIIEYMVWVSSVSSSASLPACLQATGRCSRYFTRTNLHRHKAVVRDGLQLPSMGIVCFSLDMIRSSVLYDLHGSANHDKPNLCRIVLSLLLVQMSDMV